MINIYSFARSLAIEEQTHHHTWMNEGVDFPRDKQLIPELTEVATVRNKLENGLELLKLQEKFLGLDVASDDDVMNDKGEEGSASEEE